jgi:hypothetical protein
MTFTVKSGALMIGLTDDPTGPVSFVDQRGGVDSLWAPAVSATLVRTGNTVIRSVV